MLYNIIERINSFVWGVPTLILFLGTHIFLTVRLRFIQRKIFKGIRLSLSKNEADSNGDISPFGALATSLAATIGTGNIVGVGTAVALGGPGAVLWCWLTGVFGIATKYTESLLAVKYRMRLGDGSYIGGPMLVLEKGCNSRVLAVLFCIFTGIAGFGVGNTTQANSVSVLMKETFNISPIITGLVLAVLVGVSILGGVKSISRVCEKLVPLMAFFYMGGCLLILVFNRFFLLDTIALIVRSAFSAKAIGSGMIGAGISAAARYGISRGLFSNESGMGSSAIISAAAKTKNPVNQALTASTATFWDTVVMCAITGLVIVSSIIKFPSLVHADGAVLTKAAFAQIPVLGETVLTVGLFTFALATIIGWSYYAEKALQYLFGRYIILPYRLLWTLAVFAGAVMDLKLVWDISDIMNVLMALPNLYSLFALSSEAVRETYKRVLPIKSEEKNAD